MFTRLTEELSKGSPYSSYSNPKYCSLDTQELFPMRNEDLFPKWLKTKNPVSLETGFSKERRRHTLPHNCSTICAGGLNYSVRDGKR